MDEYYWGKYVDTIKELYEAVRLHTLQTLPPCDDAKANYIAKLMGTGSTEALYILNGLHLSLPLEGDVCEFGVCQGATSALFAHEIVQTNKRLWLFDSFEGLPKPSDKDILINDIFELGSMASYEGTMSCGITEVQSRLRETDLSDHRVSIIPGFIEDVIEKAAMPSKVCFAYVDFDFYSPISVALDFLDKVLSPGGQILVDDYGFFSAGAQTAVNEFLTAHPGDYYFSLPAQFAGKFCMLKKRYVP
nr:TylF/MycF/NovP-related O-methyltransferase [uncultured Desulfobacter sp.]